MSGGDAAAFLERVLDFATAAHAGQLRKGRRGDPYIVHPVEVMEVLRAAGIDDPVILAGALLHDTVEDTAVTLERIAEAFGAGVAQLVDELTDPPGLARAERRRRQVAGLAAKSAACQAIKIADKISNLRTILRDPPLDWDEADKRGYLAFSDQVAAACARADDVVRAAYRRVRADFLAHLPPGRVERDPGGQ